MTLSNIRNYLLVSHGNEWTVTMRRDQYLFENQTYDLSFTLYKKQTTLLAIEIEIFDAMNDINDENANLPTPFGASHPSKPIS
jgi:hypothetical protein